SLTELGNSKWLATLEFQATWFCYIAHFLEFPLFLTSIILIPLNGFRYVFIINLNKSKENIKEKLEYGRYKFLFRFIRFLTKPITALIVVVIFWILWIIITVIAHSAYEFKCTRLITSAIMTIFYTIG